MLTRNHRQEALSKAYVHAIAAKCGLSCWFPDFDYGIDVSLRTVKQQGERSSDTHSVLDIQLKSTTRASVSKKYIWYDLEVKTYEDLRDVSVFIPCILVVLVVPKEESLWLDQSEDALQLRHCAYWISLRGRKPTRAKKTIRIRIPRAQVFSAESLHAMLPRLSEWRTL